MSWFLAQAVEQGWTLERVFALVLQVLGVVGSGLAIASSVAHGATKDRLELAQRDVEKGEKVIEVFRDAALDHGTEAHHEAVATGADVAGVGDHAAIVAVTK